MYRLESAAVGELQPMPRSGLLPFFFLRWFSFIFGVFCCKTKRRGELAVPWGDLKGVQLGRDALHATSFPGDTDVTRDQHTSSLDKGKLSPVKLPFMQSGFLHVCWVPKGDLARLPLGFQAIQAA